ncbi:unnamed protein product [Ectocarpus sp. 12 AP-2014]
MQIQVWQGFRRPSLNKYEHSRLASLCNSSVGSIPRFSHQKPRPANRRGSLKHTTSHSTFEALFTIDNHRHRSITDKIISRPPRTQQHSFGVTRHTGGFFYIQSICICIL